MEDAKLDKHAQSVYSTLCKLLDKRGLKYENVGKDKDGDWTVRFKGTGDDLPMEFVLFIDVKRQLIRMLSRMPFCFSEAKRIDGAIAVSHANYRMVDGDFDYNIDTGAIIFKMTSSIRNSLISEDLLNYMLNISINMTDEFNDKFFMLDKGQMTLQQFIDKY